MIDSLAHVPQLKMKSRNTIFRYKGKDADAQKAGTDLGVSALVSGRVVPRGDSIEVSATQDRLLVCVLDLPLSIPTWETKITSSGGSTPLIKIVIIGWWV